jgi:hypothetical protein
MVLKNSWRLFKPPATITERADAIAKQQDEMKKKMDTMSEMSDRLPCAC